MLNRTRFSTSILLGISTIWSHRGITICWNPITPIVPLSVPDSIKKIGNLIPCTQQVLSCCSSASDKAALTSSSLPRPAQPPTPRLLFCIVLIPLLRQLCNNCYHETCRTDDEAFWPPRRRSRSGSSSAPFVLEARGHARLGQTRWVIKMMMALHGPFTTTPGLLPVPPSSPDRYRAATWKPTWTTTTGKPTAINIGAQRRPVNTYHRI